MRCVKTVFILILSISTIISCANNDKPQCPFASTDTIPYFGWAGIKPDTVIVGGEFIKTANFLFIPPLNESYLHSRLEEVRQSGCFALVMGFYDLNDSVEKYNDTWWNWMQPILMKFSDTVHGIYLTDEPFWDHPDCKSHMKLCIDRLDAATHLIHTTTNSKFPVSVCLAYPTLKDWDMQYKLPRHIDWYAVDCYSSDFMNCSGWSMAKYYSVLESIMYERQKFVIVPSAGINKYSTSTVDPDIVFDHYAHYNDMMNDMGREKFMAIMPWMWDLSPSWFGGANFPLLGLWWNLLLTNNTLESGNFYLDGLIFGCKDEVDCEKIFPKSVATAKTNLVIGNKIRPIDPKAWTKGNCKENFNLRISSTSRIANPLKNLEIGDILYESDPKLVFLRESCRLDFKEFVKP